MMRILTGSHLAAAALLTSTIAMAQTVPPLIPFARTLDLLVVDSSADGVWRLADRNQDGDYNDAGVTSIEMLAASAGMTDVFLRVGITNGITCYVSTNAVLLPADIPGPEGLFPAIFPLNEISMTQVFGNNCGGGGDSLETVLSGVIQMRLFSAENVSWLGDVVVSEMQVDIISALGNAVVDSDGDGVADDIDNCTLVENADQRDTDLDGFGNICDADLNNDCVANVVDLGLLRTVFFTGDPDADFNGDGVVNVIDLGILRTLFFQAPGPGQGICIPVEG